MPPLFLLPLWVLFPTLFLVPFYPIFSRLAAPENWRELKTRIRQGLFLGALAMLPFTGDIYGFSFAHYQTSI